MQRINDLEPEMQQLEDADFPIRIAQYKQEVQEGVRDLDALLEVFAMVREARYVPGMPPADAQLVGGMVLHKGKIAEMGDWRRQDLGRNFAGGAECPVGQGRARCDSQRLSGQARCGLDGPAKDFLLV